MSSEEVRTGAGAAAAVQALRAALRRLGEALRVQVRLRTSGEALRRRLLRLGRFWAPGAVAAAGAVR